MWALYYGAIRPEFKSTRRYRLAFESSESMQLDVTADILSIGLFVVSTWMALDAVFS